MPTRKTALIAILMSVAVVSAAPASVLDDLSRDFAPIAGIVVQPAEGGFLIDRTAADGIDAGDLFSVVQPGERIVHPASGKELGTLDRVKGFLQVTRVRPGYSFTRALGATEEIRSGDAIRRFEHVPALFLDRTGAGKPFYDRLRAALPGLEWTFREALAAGTVQAAPEGAWITFLFGPDAVEVRIPDAPPRTYRIFGAKAGEGSGAEAETAAAPPAERPPAAEREPAGRATPGDFVVRGTLPDGTLMADFARDGSRLLLAVTDGRRIEVFEVADRLTPVASGGSARGGRVQSLHWWRPAAGGPLLLAATLAVGENEAYSPVAGETVAGSVYALRGGAVAPIRESIPYLLGSFDRDGDGEKETLLGQSFDRDVFFGGRIRELRLEGESVAIREPSFSVPRPFVVQGAAFADLTGDGRPESVFVRGGKLVVYDGSELLYESSQQMGGSLSAFTYDVNPGAADRLFTTAAFEVPPAAADLDGDGRRELLAVATEGSAVPGIGSGVRKSWVATLERRDGRFVRGSIGPELETPLQGLYPDRDGVFVVATYGPSLFKPGRASHLLFLPWNRRAGR